MLSNKVKIALRIFIVLALLIIFAVVGLVLGGGIGKAAPMAHPDMYEGADRVWHAARLWRAQVKRRKEKGESADVSFFLLRV